MTEIDASLLKEPTTEEKSDTFSVMEFILRYIRYWKWFVCCVLIALSGALIYLRYTTPVYNVSSSIILKQSKDQRYGSRSAMDELGIGMGMLGTVTNLENETFILQSRSIIRDVINRLNLHTSYIVSGRIKSTDLYVKSPVVVSMEQGNLDRLKRDIRFVMQFEDGKIIIFGKDSEQRFDTVFAALPKIGRASCRERV